MTSGHRPDDLIAPDAAPTDCSARNPAPERDRSALDVHPDPIVVHQMGVIVYANRAAARRARVSRRELVGRLIAEFIRPDHLPAVYGRMAALGSDVGVPSEPHDVVVVDGSGHQRSAEITSERTVWRNEPAYQVMVRLHAPVENHRAATSSAGAVSPTRLPHPQVHPDGDDAGATRSSARRGAGSDSVVAALPQAILVVGHDRTVDFANPLAVSLLGLPDKAIPGLDIADLPLEFPDDPISPITVSLDSGADVLDRTATIATPPAGQSAGATEDTDAVPAHRRWLSCSCVPLPVDDTGRVAVLVSIGDITTRHHAAQRLAWEATHDHLTGMLNRSGVLKRLESRLGDTDEPDAQVAVYYLDLDNFKMVNDSLSHSFGDEVLHVVAARLRAALPPAADIGRIASDEFLIVSPLRSQASDSDTDAQIAQQAEAIHAIVDAPMEIGPLSERISVSIGMTLSRHGDGSAAESLLRDAGIALSEAKASPREPFVRFRVEHRHALRRRQRIEQDLRETLRSGADQLRVVYQPIVTPRDHRVVAVEALVRWDHPELGAISPSEFIPIAEHTNLIDAVSDHVLRAATKEFAECCGHHQRLAAHRGMKLSVNISRPELADRGLVSRVTEALAESGLPAHRLCIEITERDVLVDHSGAPATATLTALRNLGVMVALDDFGTGASSLNQLHRLPIDTLKVAECLVCNVDGDDRATAILSGVAQMARSLGMTLVAEGVENADQADRVADIGCDLAQGFYYDVPRPLAEIGATAARRA